MKRYSKPYIKEAIDDALKRLIYPSIEREARAELNEVAEEQAIDIFSMNVQSFITTTTKGTQFLGIDPAFRTGCKLSARTTR